MRTRFIIFLLLCAAQSGISSAQTPTITDAQNENLRGHVKFVRSDRYHVVDSGKGDTLNWFYTGLALYDSRGNYIYTKSIDANHQFDDSVHYTYDTRGNLVLEETYNAGALLTEQHITVYNTQGCLLTNTVKEYDTDHGRTTDSFITIDSYHYNDKQQLTEVYKSVLDEDGSYTASRLYYKYAYDDTGKKRTQYEYRNSEDPSAPIISYETMNEHGKVVESRNDQTYYTHVYDNKGRIVRTDNYHPQSGAFLSYHIRSYDKWGNCTSETTYDSSGHVERYKMTTTYPKLDKKGNWREAKGYRNSVYIYYCRRQISYY